MKRNNMIKKAIAGISAVATLATVTPAMAADNTFALKSNSVLTAVVEDGTQYILGPAADGSWTYQNLFDQMEENSTLLSVMTGASLSDPVVTGYEQNINGEHIVTVVKGDLLGKGTYNISQLVTMAKLMGNPSSYTRAQQMAADIDGNGSVNISDLVKMAKNDIQGVAVPTVVEVQAPVEEAPAPAPTVEATQAPVETAPVVTPAPTVEATPEATPAPVVEVTELSLQEQNEMMLALVNELRAKEGSAPLRISPQLMQVANVRATEMAYARMSCGHSRPDGSSCFTVAEHVHAENTGSRSGNIVEALQDQFVGWDLCPGHHRNMVNPKRTTIGFAMAPTDMGSWVCVQVFSDDSADSITWISDPILVAPKYTDEVTAAWVEACNNGLQVSLGEFYDNYWNK